MKKQEDVVFTIGKLAAMAGVSVRTLQYYDRIGLLKSTLSEGGRRTYTRDDVIKLQQILFFKSLGFSLEEILEKILKFKSPSDLGEIFTSQREILAGQVENLKSIMQLLNVVIFEIDRGQDISIDKLMMILHLMKQGNPYAFVLGYLDAGQLRNIRERFQMTGLQKKNTDFVEKSQEIFAELNTLYQNGADPAGAEGQELAKRWWDMVTEFTGGDPVLLKTLVGVGADINAWPDETKDFRGAIEHFLGKALDIYLHGRNIDLSQWEAGQNE